MAFILAALAGPALAAPPAPGMPEAMTGVRWATRDPKTGEVTMILQGERTSVSKGKAVDVVRPVITFFDQAPPGPGPRLPILSKTVVTAEHAVYQQDAEFLSLDGKVVMTRSDGTTVRTESLEWDRPKGRFATPAAAEITDGSSVISGAGLEGRTSALPDGSQVLDRITLERDVKTVLAGDFLSGLDDLFATVTPSAAAPAAVTITCGGRMLYLPRAGTIEYTEGVLARDALRNLTARSLSLALSPERRPVKLVATGGVRARGQRGDEAAGETFTWDASARGPAADKRPVAVLSGAPYVRVESASGTIRASRVTFDRGAGTTEFAGPGIIELPASPSSGGEPGP